MGIDLRPVALVAGIALVLLALAMLVPAWVDFTHDCASWKVFAASAAVVGLTGALMAATNAQCRPDLGIRQIFLLTAFGWSAAALAASLPFALSDLGLSAADAVFEATSGVTATGATVLRHLESVPPGFLMWRAVLQWLGGGGALLVAALVLPALNIGGMELFRIDTLTAGPRGLSRPAMVALAILGVYALLTALITVLLLVAGMGRFPALLHAMSTISCGGFSTADASIGAWSNPGVDWTILLGMILGGAPFIVYTHLFRRRFGEILGNSQLRWYGALLLLGTLALMAWLWFARDVKPLPALRHGAFAIASVMTGTGYATLDFGRWGGLPVTILFFLSFVGGCAGSAAGGLKIFRLQILLDAAHHMTIRLMRPNLVLPHTYDGKPVSDRLTESVLGFLFVYIASFALLALMLAMLGLDFMSAVSVAISALANMGPGLTQAAGPLSGYADLSDAAKWLLSAAMLFGRVEMLVMLALFTPFFWERR